MVSGRRSKVQDHPGGQPGLQKTERGQEKEGEREERRMKGKGILHKHYHKDINQTVKRSETKCPYNIPSVQLMERLRQRHLLQTKGQLCQESKLLWQRIGIFLWFKHYSGFKETCSSWTPVEGITGHWGQILSL